MERILIIEDESMLREMIVELLEEEGFHCIEAENGKLGVEAAKIHIPDLIVCDVKMPEMNGHEVLDELKKNPHTSTIPFIFLSAMVDKRDQRKGMNLGADDYLTKPFEPEDLITAIKTRLIKNSEIKKRINELKESIALSLPHELQTPLISIIGYSQLLLEKFSNEKNKQEYEFAKTINDAGNRLNKLIQNFIVYTRLKTTQDADNIPAEAEPVIVTPSLVKDIALKVAEKYDREDDITTDLSEAKLKIDLGDFSIALNELIDNAFKFSSAGSEVSIKNRIENKNYILEISDKGRGMTGEQISKLGAYIQFERKQYEQQGSGLGFAISKRIIELNNGSVKVSSSYGKETILKITLPSIT